MIDINKYDLMTEEIKEMSFKYSHMQSRDIKFTMNKIWNIAQKEQTKKLIYDCNEMITIHNCMELNEQIKFNKYLMKDRNKLKIELGQEYFKENKERKWKKKK